MVDVKQTLLDASRNAVEDIPSELLVEEMPVLRIVLLVMTAGALAIAAGVVLLAPDQMQRAAGPVLMAITSATALWSYHSGRALQGRILMIYGSLVAIALAIFLGGGLRSLATLTLAPLVIASSVVSRQTGRNIAFACFALIVLIGLAEIFDLLPGAPLLPFGMLWLVNLAVIIVAAGIGLYLRTLHQVRTRQEQAIASQLAQEKAALALQQEQLRLIAENVPAMIAYNDRDLMLRYANRHYLEFFGLDGRTAVGRPLRDIIGEKAFREAEPLLLQALSGQPVSYRGMRRSASGHERIIEVESVPDYGAEGEVRGAYALMRDVTDQQRADEALKSGQARLAEAQRIGRFGSWELDLASKHLLWTEELFKIYECDPAAFGGTWDALLKMVHPDDLAVIRTAFRESAEVRGAYEIDHRILTPEGHIKHLHVRWEVFFDAEGKPVRALGTAQDITEQTLAKVEIQRLNDELETRVRERTAELQTANKELESFAYSISHDLRAPLRGIDGFSQLLVDEYRERLDAQGVDYLDRVRRAAQRMGTLIDDILELSRVTRKEMRRVKVDLSQIAAELIEERARSEPEHRVSVTLAPDCMAFGDPQLLRVMMQNLLENAWKYSSREAAPAIAFGREMNGDETVFFVRDNGVGFDMQYANRLFAPFQRLHKPEDFEGTGIGLATVARVVHRHGGRVWAEAAVGEGATFRFTLTGSGMESPTSASDATAI